MRKLWIFLSLLVLLAAAGFYAVLNLNVYLHDNRAWLAEQAAAALGRPVKFDTVAVSFRAGLGARVSGLSIGDDPAFSKDDFLRVGTADVVVKILPALRGRYEVRKIALHAPEINVIRGPRGFNFESIGRAAAAEPPREAAQPDAAEEPSAAPPLLVALVNVEDGRLRFVDRTTSPSAETVLGRLDVSVSDLGFDQPIALDLALAVLGSQQQNLRVTGSVGPLGDAGVAAHAPVDIKVTLGGLVIDRLKQVGLVGPVIPAALSSPDPIDAVVELSGNLDDLRAALSVDASKAAIAYADQVEKASGVALRLVADVKRRHDAIEITQLDLRIAAASLQGKGSIGTTAALPIDLQLTATGVPLDGWASLVPAASVVDASGTVDVRLAAKGNAGGGRVPALNGTIALAGAGFARPDGSLRVEGLDTVVSLQGERIEIPATRFQVNGSPVQVAATVKSLRDLATEFSLTSPELALAALGAGGEGSKQAELVKDLEVRGEFRSAGDGPQLNVTVQSSAGSVRDVAYEKLAGEATLRGDKVTLRRLSISTFGGNIVGAGSFDMAQRQDPELAFRGKVGGLDVAALVERFAPSGSVKMTGRLDANLDMRGHGATWDVLKQALSGGGAIDVKDGVLKGVNIADEVLRGVGGVQGLSGLVSPSVRQKYPEIFSNRDTVFDVLESRMTLADGVAAVEPIALVAHDYRLDGKGTIGLDNTLDLHLRFVAAQNLTEDLLGSVKQLKYVADEAGRFQIPVVLTGSVPSIRLQPDVEFLTKRLTGALVETGIEKGLGALFGKKKKEAASAGEDAASAGEDAVAPPDQEAPAEKLLRKGLEGLFGGAKKSD